MANKPHKTLDAWKQGIELTIETYRLTEKLPSEERLGLAAQMRRAAVSVPSNVAEGAAKNTTAYCLPLTAYQTQRPYDLKTPLTC